MIWKRNVNLGKDVEKNWCGKVNRGLINSIVFLSRFWPLVFDVSRSLSSFGLPSNLVHGRNNVSSVSKIGALKIFLANAPFLRVDCEVNAGPTTDEESTLASVTFRGCDLPSSFSRGEEEGRAMVESLLDKVLRPWVIDLRRGERSFDTIAWCILREGSSTFDWWRNFYLSYRLNLVNLFVILKRKKKLRKDSNNLNWNLTSSFKTQTVKKKKKNLTDDRR